MKEIFTKIISILKEIIHPKYLNLFLYLSAIYFFIFFSSPFIRFIIISINIKLFCSANTFRPPKTKHSYSPVSFIQFFCEHFYHSTQNDELFNNQNHFLSKKMHWSLKIEDGVARTWSRIRNRFFFFNGIMSMCQESQQNEGLTKIRLRWLETPDLISYSQKYSNRFRKFY